MGTGNLPLGQALTSLRNELLTAVRQAESESLTFVVDTVEVQLQVVATTAAGATVGGGFWQVVTLGGKVDHSRAATHLVKLILKPRLNGEPDVEVGDPAMSWRPAIPVQPE